MLTDATIELAKYGPVTVISRDPESLEALPSSPFAGVNVIRCRNFRFGRSVMARLNSYASYILAALWRLLRIPRPEAVVTLTTPPLLSVLGSVSKVFRGTPHYIWEMDVYPDIAIDLGVIGRERSLARMATSIANWSRRRADGIIVLGEDMKARLIAHGIPASKIVVCENWADAQDISPRPFPGGPLTILYSGNFGLAHDVQTIRAAIDRLANDSRFRFVFSGEGARLEELRAFCRERNAMNVEFQSFCSRSEMGNKLAQGDLGLVTQLPASLGSLVPCKTYGIMAAGRPLLFIGPKTSTPATYIDRFQCGWRIEPGDADALVSLLEDLADNPQRIREAGRRGREAFTQHFDRAIGVARISAAIHSGFAPPLTGIQSAKPASAHMTLENEPGQQLTL